MYTLPQRLAAEFIGVFAVVFVSAGAVCADQFLRAANQGGIGVLGIALAYGLAVGVVVSAVAHISGGHINPAVTIGFWVTKKMGTFESLLYWVAQLVGAMAAAYALRVILPEDTWRPVALGTPALARDFSVSSGILLEAVTTFFLVFVFFAAAADEHSALRRSAGFVVGLTVAAGVLAGWPFTGAAMNPARALGPALASSHWIHHGVYWVGPLLGGALAAALYDGLFLKSPGSGARA